MTQRPIIMFTLPFKALYTCMNNEIISIAPSPFHNIEKEVQKLNIPLTRVVSSCQGRQHKEFYRQSRLQIAFRYRMQ